MLARLEAEQHIRHDRSYITKLLAGTVVFADKYAGCAQTQLLETARTIAYAFSGSTAKVEDARAWLSKTFPGYNSDTLLNIAVAGELAKSPDLLLNSKDRESITKLSRQASTDQQLDYDYLGQKLGWK